ncbi:MAG: ATP-binding cassette domain-containing protein [Treponema sp.]|nr:ATP-binding cassette domain-containing protein [Treponema sp.]
MGMILFLFDVFAGIKAYYGSIARLTVTDACLDRIENVFEEAEIKNEGTESIPEPGSVDESVPEISYQNVSFAYGNKDTLHDISFDAKRGEMIALVRPSGGGKTTIANLLARFWDAKKARCYDFIMQLPDGFDTVIGEGGSSLSGGEQQRISIARCMLKDAPIVILDEATASVDADNEHFIQEAISELCRGKTLIVIAHRLNTIRNADRILVIRDGQISESGTHDELMELDGEYAGMVNKQNS